MQTNLLSATKDEWLPGDREDGVRVSGREYTGTWETFGWNGYTRGVFTSQRASGCTLYKSVVHWLSLVPQASCNQGSWMSWAACVVRRGEYCSFTTALSKWAGPGCVPSGVWQRQQLACSHFFSIHSALGPSGVLGHLVTQMGQVSLFTSHNFPTSRTIHMLCPLFGSIIPAHPEL